MEKLGRFGHHPDPAIDFCVEVEEIEGMTRNVEIGFDEPVDVIARFPLALDFKVGGDLGAVAARGVLLRCAEKVSAVTGISI